MRRVLTCAALALVAWTAVTLPSADASAFCGFYVAGGGARLFNDATQAVMMRQGTRTVLSIQNSYKGPPRDFAMVVPVPQVLHKENVKTLPKDVFDKIDRLSAPRLVEYWEQDPCYQPEYKEEEAAVQYGAGPTGGAVKGAVKVEAKFSVGEYDVVVLSAEESTALDTWLHQNHYQIPDGAEPYFRPYVEGGSFFFVAKVNAKKVKYEDGRAVLSPLRFAYDTDKFQLPIRLGMINSSGKQDLIVYILASQRYELANYPNVTIPTNIEVQNSVRDRFPEFYTALFDRTLEKNTADKPPVVTEYAWSAGSCDPCPGPTLDRGDYLTFGADTLEQQPGAWVLTRLHARYGRDDVGEDLVFKAANGIVGGRQGTGNGAKTSAQNNFQGRYIIRHEWKGKVECDDPQYGIWGGPPDGNGSTMAGAAASANTRAKAPITKKSPVDLAKSVAQAVPALGIDAPPSPEKGKAHRPSPKRGETTEHLSKSCKGCATSPSGSSGLWLLLVGLFVVGRRFFSLGEDTTT